MALQPCPSSLRIPSAAPLFGGLHISPLPDIHERRGCRGQQATRPVRAGDSRTVCWGEGHPARRSWMPPCPPRGPVSLPPFEPPGFKGARPGGHGGRNPLTHAGMTLSAAQQGKGGTQGGSDRAAPVLGREAAERLRREFVYGPHGPYSHRAPVKGRPIKLDLSAPLVSCTFSTTETDEEEEAAEQARMCLEYEMSVRKFRRRARRARAKWAGTPGAANGTLDDGREDSGEGLQEAAPPPPVSYFFAFVSNSPPPPSSSQVWEAWTLVAQVAVENPAMAKGPEKGNVAGASEASMVEGLETSRSRVRPGSTEAERQSPAQGPLHTVDKFALEGRMSGKAMNRIVQCVGWFRPDLIFVKRPCFELRFEPQEDFFEVLLPLVSSKDSSSSSLVITSQTHEPSGEVDVTDLYSAICKSLRLDARSSPAADEIAEAFEDADAQGQGSVLGAIFQAASMQPHIDALQLASPKPPVQINPIPQAAASGGTHESKGTDAGAVDYGVSAVAEFEEFEEGQRTRQGRQKEKPERIKLFGKEGQRGASGLGAWKIAVCPYDFSRLVYEVCHVRDVVVSAAGGGELICG